MSLVSCPEWRRSAGSRGRSSPWPRVRASELPCAWPLARRGSGPGAAARSDEEDHAADEHRRDVDDHRRSDDRDRQRPGPDGPTTPSVVSIAWSLARISQAAATQRAGRAGRTGQVGAPGHGPERAAGWWHLRDRRGAPDRPCGGGAGSARVGCRDAGSFAWFDRPAPERLDAGRRLSTSLAAIDPSETNHAAGQAEARIPVHPRLAGLLIAAVREGRSARGGGWLPSREGHGSTGRAAAHRPGPDAGRSSRAGRSDLLRRLGWLAEAESSAVPAQLRERGIDPAAAGQVVRVRDDLVRLAARSAEQPGHIPRPDETTKRSSSGRSGPIPAGSAAARLRADRGDGRRPRSTTGLRVDRP